MSKVKELAYDIEQLFIEGLTEKNIAKTLDIPVEIVYAWMEENNVNDDVDAAEWDELEAFDQGDL
jgi:orotate phosphoribosyltransferase-like protein